MKPRTYGQNRKPEDSTRCVASVYVFWSSRQCNRKRGFGENGLYCKQHAIKRGDSVMKEKKVLYKVLIISGSQLVMGKMEVLDETVNSYLVEASAANNYSLRIAKDNPMGIEETPEMAKAKFIEGQAMKLMGLRKKLSEVENILEKAKDFNFSDNFAD